MRTWLSQQLLWPVNPDFSISVILAGMDAEGKCVDFKAISEHDGLIERYKSRNMDGIISLYNKTPMGSDETKSYRRNYHGRVMIILIILQTYS